MNPKAPVLFWWALGLTVASGVAHAVDPPWLDPNRAIQSAAPAAVGCEAAPANDWEKAGFKNARVATLDLAPMPVFGGAAPAATHELKLTVVLFRGSRWKASHLRDRYRKVARIYATCGVRLSEVQWVESDAWHGRLDMHGGDDPDVGIERQLVAAVPAGVARPLLFLVRSIEDGSIAVANPAYYVGANHPLLNTVFAGEAALAADSQSDPAYSTEAHELGHVLGGIRRHTRESDANLMSDERSAQPNGRLTPAQCAEIRKSPLLRRL